MNYREAMQYIDELRPLGRVMGLGSMRQLCEELGNPQEQLKFVHIAGTNGKGSTLAYISTVMKEAGYRIGRYLSPAVKEYRESFQVDGRIITQSGFCKYLEPVKAAVESMVAQGLPHPTLFEVETAVAFLFFQDKECDLVVLETGLGGTLDATNVVEQTLAAVFTPISMDHMDILGDSLEEIASAKAGIIKNKCYVISVKQSPEVMKILRQAAREYHSAVTAADCVQEAVEIAYLLTGKDKDAVIVAFGSLSYLGELTDIVTHRDTIRRDTHGRSDKN